MSEVITECTCGQIEPGMPGDVIDVITVRPSPEMRAAILAAAGIADMVQSVPAPRVMFGEERCPAGCDYDDSGLCPDCGAWR